MLMVEMNERGVIDRCRLAPMDGSSTGQQIGPPIGSCTFAAWSPDGEWMYFSSDSGGAFHTWRQRFPDGQPEQITSGPTEEEGLAMAPDGRSFITAVGLTQSSVWLHDGGGDRQVSLEGYAFAPKFTPDGKRLLYQVRKGAASELWVAEPDSGRSEPLLPGFAVALTGTGGSYASYDISPDGLQVVVASPDNGGESHLWLAPLDRRSPPRQIPNIEGEQPVFGATGEVFFRRVEGTSAFLYGVQEDGGKLRKAFDVPIVGLTGESPDRNWLALGSTGAVILWIDGGAPLRTGIPASATRLSWSGDRKHLFVQGKGAVNLDKAYVLPLSPGQMVPDSIVNGLPSEQEILKLPGARLIPLRNVVPGPTADIYAFTRQSVQRNLYRIPVP
jgi:hypothetical protein